ncbi:MAG: integrase core domain-containing protein, partial [bacterium]
QRLRAEFVMLARESDTCMKRVCSEFGISRKTGYKWLRRYEEHGMSGLVSRSRRPRGNPLQLSGAVVVSLVGIHEEHPGWGPKKLRARLARLGHHPEELPCVSTVARLARRLGWTEARGRGRPRRVLPAGPLSDAEAPNEVWTADFKGWWRTADGRHCEPLTVRDLYSRYLLCVRPLARRSVSAVQQVFGEVFEQYGLPATIRTDNGGPFAAITGPHGLTRLSAWWRTLGIRLERIACGHPEQNGGHERMHRDIAEEIQRRPAANLAEEAERLEGWRRAFNVERPHEALGMRTPGDVYRRSGRNLGDVRPYGYPPGFERRHVRHDGCIWLQNKAVYLSVALGKTSVGLERLAENSWRVWFCDLPIGVVKRICGRLICQSEA